MTPKQVNAIEVVLIHLEKTICPLCGGGDSHGCSFDEHARDCPAAIFYGILSEQDSLKEQEAHK